MQAAFACAIDKRGAEIKIKPECDLLGKTGARFFRIMLQD
jgi:hypothetical protein